MQQRRVIIRLMMYIFMHLECISFLTKEKYAFVLAWVLYLGGAGSYVPVTAVNALRNSTTRSQ